MEKILQERYVMFEDVSMDFSTSDGYVRSLEAINFNIKEREFVSIIGHSGSGKSTMLQLMAGFLTPSDGHLFFAGREIAGAAPERAMVFQRHALLPWLTCFENVHLAVAQVFARETYVQQEERTLSALDSVGLSRVIDKRPHQLSASMRQRAGLARALAMQPKLLLLDEPFSALDAPSKAHLQDELIGRMARTHCTTVMVTHDVDEALLLSDKVILMTAEPTARIREILTIDLPRPRARLGIMEDKQYQHLRNEILKFLYQPQHLKQVA